MAIAIKIKLKEVKNYDTGRESKRNGRIPTKK